MPANPRHSLSAVHLPILSINCGVRPIQNQLFHFCCTEVFNCDLEIKKKSNIFSLNIQTNKYESKLCDQEPTHRPYSHRTWPFLAVWHPTAPRDPLPVMLANCGHSSLPHDIVKRMLSVLRPSHLPRPAPPMWAHLSCASVSLMWSQVVFS